ncbi:MAG: diguanylate cyclase [Anaerolineales bacterium]|nr:diguanylate cyclase [Anaerolineales bacterium]
MNPLDIRTVMASYIFSNAICLLVIFLMWRQNRTRFSGLGFWLADYSMQFAAVVLIAVRTWIPEIVAVLLGNGLVVAGTILLLLGLERFHGKRGPQIHNALLLAVFLALQVYFYVFSLNLTARNINLSLALTAVCGQCAWLMLRRADPQMRPNAQTAGIIFIGYVLASVFRIAADLAVPSSNDFFQSGIYDTLVLMTYQMLFVALTFSLFLMVNRRLRSDLEEDIAVRGRVEENFRVAQEKMATAFHASPDAILITRLRDGKLLEVNDGFDRLSGYARDEAMDSSTLQLSLWADPRERERMVAALAKEGRLHNFEADFRRKSGEVLHCLISAETIELAGEPHILSIVRDVSEWHRAREIVRLRLDLWEYSANHTVEELMRKALDEIEDLTGSAISFYHFVMEDEKTLALQAWSTRTLREFCRAEGKGMHYELDRAGVWADAVRLRKPVIHNDYAALPGRRGMPPGHAAVHRELVVPTLHGGRIVSVLGIGNKPSPYDERDAVLLDSIADIIWTIVDHKRTDEEIHRLQRRLEEMAVRDSLTGLFNRHYLDITLQRELARAAREKYAVSFILLDIDHFKRVNDTFGHKAGDGVLRELAGLLLKNSRASDIIFRYGGEEFLAMLPKVKPDAAFRVAEKWRTGFRNATMLLEYGGVQATISLGIAAFPAHGGSAAELIAAADRALYLAKTSGRNRSAVYQRTEPPAAA